MDSVGPVDEAVYDCFSGDVIGDHFTPVFQRKLRCDDRAFVLIAFLEDVVQILGHCLRKCFDSKVVEDQAVCFDQTIAVLQPCSFGTSNLDSIDEFVIEPRVGTVNKFQGQEAPVVIYSMACSSVDSAPRGMSFLFSLNRLNVATSRAKCVCILVCSKELLLAPCTQPEQIKLANALCRYVELSKEISPKSLLSTAS